MIHDLRDARRALSSTSRVGLGPQAAMYLTVGPWKAEALESENDAKGFVDAAHIDREKLLEYNAKDSAYTAGIRSHHIREFAVPDRTERLRLQRLYDHQRRLAEVASRMSLLGFPVDERQRRRLAKELFRIARDRQEHLAKLIRPHAKTKIHPAGQGDAYKKTHFRISDTGGVNERDLAALLFAECARPGIRSFGLEVPIGDQSRTESGAPSVNKDALLYLFIQPGTPAEVKAICRATWEADSPLKARSTYVTSNKVLNAIGPDGRMHAGINSCGTETGRWSCSDPNIFNLPEAQEEGSMRGELPNMRSIYVAPLGYTIVHRDMRGFELEVMAEVTGDRPLRAALDTGDTHTARTRQWFNVPEGTDVPKGLRKMVKVIGLACQYHAGLEAVFLQVLRQIPDANFDEIALLHGTYAEKHPGIAQWWETSLRDAKRLGYSETAIMERRRYYPPGDILDTDTSNYRIQGTAADIANCIMVGREKSDYKNSLTAKLAKYFPSAWLAMHTYDSFDIICKRRDAKSVDRLAEECMAGPWRAGEKLKLFPSDGKIARRWSDV